MDPVNPQPQTPPSRVDRLGEELEELKKTVLAEQNQTVNPPVMPGVPTPTEPITMDQKPDRMPSVEIPPSRKGNPIIKLGLLLLAASVIILLFGIVKSVTKNGKPPVFKKTADLSTPTSVPVATPDVFAGWKLYEDPAGVYSFRYPMDFSPTDYRESINSGIKISKLTTSDQSESNLTNGLIIKAILIPKIQGTAQTYAEEMLSQAVRLTGSKASASKITVEKVGNGIAYGYQITGYGTARDLYVQVGSSLVRIQVTYVGTESSEKDYQTIIQEILGSFIFAAESKGGLGSSPVSTSTKEPSSGFGM